MKTAILCYNKVGEDGREPGVIIHLKEFKDEEEVTWGKNTACKSPTFFTIVLKDQKIADLPDTWKEFGGHRSRIVLNKTAMSAAEVEAVEKDERLEVTYAAFATKVVDKGSAWKPKVANELAEDIWLLLSQKQ